MKKSKKPMLIMIIVLAVVFGGIFAYDFLREFMIARFFAHFQLPPATVSATTAKAQVWQPMLSTVGSLVAVNGIEITPQVAGDVTDIEFQSGDIVKQGQLLVKLDDSADQQDLINYQAQLKLAQINFQRQKTLYSQAATAAAALDEARAKMQQAEALVEKTKILIGYKSITAPFTGRIGIRQISIGQYISPGNPMVSLQSIDPIYVDFTLPEQFLKDLYVKQPVTVTVDAYPGQEMNGQIIAINSLVDVGTRSIQVRAEIPNSDGKLYPGIFANVKVILPNKLNVITVPQTAISYNLYGDIVYVIKDNKAYRQIVKTGETRGDEVVVLSGLKAGDVVATSGQLKLSNEMPVKINNQVSLNG